MKLLQDFNAFLNETVNLNSTRFDQLESSIESIKSAVRGLDWKPTIVGFAAQGSWAHKTIIKPLPGDPFESPRVSRRLNTLRGLSHEEDKQVLTRGA